jgi:hypothetical protein
MKVIYLNQQPPRPGYGVLLLSDLGLPPENVRFMLKRASDHKCLSPAGWQDAEVFLLPERMEINQDGVSLFIGPPVVDNLDMQESYRLFLEAGGSDYPNAGFRAQRILYSTLAASPALESQPPAPEIKAPIAPEPSKSLTPQEEKPETKPETKPSDLGMPVPEPSGSSFPKRPLLILAILLLLGAGAFAAWRFEFFGILQADAPPLQQARELLGKSDAGAEESLRLALKLKPLADDESTDAAFLLLEYAAHKNNGQAMLHLARYYDPSDNQPHGSIIKDVEQAAAWYARAAESGVAEAKDALQMLKDWQEKNE